jgi:Holliday junction resolvase-like predicted endonuclease
VAQILQFAQLDKQLIRDLPFRLMAGRVPTKTSLFTSWHVGVAAEALAAALFARCGYDVSVQYGANQPEYDLLVAKDEQLLKVSVKGSQDGSWGLCQSYLKPKSAAYHDAIDRWLKRHKVRTILCLVQFRGVAVTAMPRVYLATPQEVARRLHETAKGRGDTILYEHHSWGSRARGAGTVEEIPRAWQFSPERVEQLLEGGFIGVINRLVEPRPKARTIGPRCR